MKLLDFRLFINHVLACFRVEFFHFQLFSLGTLVFGGGVEVTGTS